MTARQWLLVMTAMMLGACGGGSEKPSKQLADALGTLFPAPAPGLAGPFAKLQFGMALEAARAAAPGLLGDVDARNAASHRTRLELLPKADVRLQISSKGLEQITIWFHEPGVRTRLTELWGPPEKVDGDHHWWNPEARVRARLASTGNGDAIFVDRYQPLALLLGDGERLGFEAGAPVLGQSIDAIRAGFGAALYEESVTDMLASRERIARAVPGADVAVVGGAMKGLYLAPTEYGGSTIVWLEHDSGTVESIRMKIGASEDAQVRRRVQGAIERRFPGLKHGDRAVEIIDLGGDSLSLSIRPRAR